MSGYCPSPYKDTFPSMSRAQKVIRNLERRSRNGKSHSLPQMAYKCPCGQYHLTYPKPRTVQDREKVWRKYPRPWAAYV